MDASTATEQLSFPEAAPASCRPADLSTMCLNCGSPMTPEHAHYRCPSCGWRDSCCDGPY